MNKLFSKIIGASLAIAMMIGVGVGVNASKAAKPVDADEESAYTITFGNNAKSATALSSSTNATTAISGGTNYVASKPFTVNSGNVYYGDTKTCIRLGKSGNNASLSIALSDNGKVKATKFVVNCMRMAGDKNSSATLSVNGMTAQSAPAEADNLTFTYGTETDITSIQLSSVKAVYVYSIQVFKYKLSADPAKTVQANSVVIKSGSTTISDNYEPTSPYYFGSTLDLTNSEVVYEQGDAYQNGLGNINWSSSNTNVATVSDGVVTYVSAGTTTITATAEDSGENNATVSASFVLDLSNGLYVPGSANNPYSVDEARAAIDAGTGINGVYATGIVSEIVTAYSTQYSNVTFNISADGETEGNQLQAYRCGGSGADDVDIGDTVIITGNLKKHNSTYEFDQGCSIVTRTPAQYTVTYNANGATSGTVPVDNTQYSRNAQVTLALNTGNLQKTGYTFNGWNTKADPTADGASHYNAGAQIQITKNIVLYAEWLSNSPSITVQANFSGYTGQELNLEFTYGNIADDTKIGVVAANNKITVTELIVDGGEGVVTIAFNTAGDSSLSFQNDGNELATCVVTINQSVMSITGMPSKEKIQINETLNLGSQVTISSSGIYSSDVIWETSDSNIATVSQSGVVTGKAVGQVTITVTSLDKDDVHQSCVVNVYKGPVSNAIDLSTATYDAASDDLVTWTCDYATMANAVGTGNNTKPNNYLGGTGTYASSRMYKNNVMTITPSNGYIIAYVEFDATTNGYATALKNSTWNNASATANNSLVTVTPTDGSAAFGATISNTCGFTEVRFYITPKSLLKPASVIKTISGVESNGGATVNNVALRFGGVIPVSTWNSINTNWEITDYGVMFARESMLTARSKTSLEEVFRNNPADVAIVHKQTFTAPVANGDDYVFTARLNLEESDYDTVFYAAPYIVAGGEYYFLQEEHKSVRTLANDCYNNGGSSLSQTALATLKGNN